MQCTVISSIVGGKDAVVEEQVTGDATFLLFTDSTVESKVWNVRPAYDRFLNARRNSRVPKILPHLFCDTEYSITMDGSMALLTPPEELIATYLKDTDIAVFTHGARDCIYDEAIKCATAKLDDPEVIIEQATAYENAGYAKHKGLCECGFIIRRHTSKVRQFNNEWWAQYTRYSVRDQISFMFAVDTVGIKLNVIDIPWHLAVDGTHARRGNIIKMYPHKILNPTVN